jgi:heme-degrading monooxygenase HmoA
MITELVEMDIKPGSEAAFEAAFQQCMTFLGRSNGCASAQMLRSIENPSRYRLLVQWQTLEDHTEKFRGSADHKALKEVLAAFVERSSGPEHHSVALESFAKV